MSCDAVSGSIRGKWGLRRGCRRLLDWTTIDLIIRSSTSSDSASAFASVVRQEGHAPERAAVTSRMFLKWVPTFAPCASVTGS